MFSVVKSNNALIFDTLPSLRVRYFHLRDKTPSIYTYAQLYVLQDSICLNLRAFEQTPPPQSVISFALAGQNGCLLLSVSPNDATLDYNHEKFLGESELNLSRFAGEDEHGWYWGAQTAINAKALAAAGISTDIGAAFKGAVFKAHDDFGVIGASYPLPRDGEIVLPKLFNDFIVSEF